MSQCLFFFTNVGSIEACRNACRVFGINTDGGMSFSEVIGAGPDGNRGYIASRESSGVGYYPHLQTWADGGDCWVGWYNSSPPGPNDFAVDELIDGHAVRLGDGKEWMIPVARQFPQGTKLPQTLRLGSSGLTQVVAPAYVELWEKACRIADIMLGNADDADVSAESMFRTALQALQVNYVVSLPEVNALGLFTDVAVRGILQAMIDLPSILEYAKKKEGQGNGSANSGWAG